MNTNQIVEILDIPGGATALLALVVWSLIWKGLALWKSAQREEKGWFIAILILNTLGILDILYLYVFSKDKSTAKPQESTPTV